MDYVFSSFKKTLISTNFHLNDKRMQKIEKFQFFAEKSIFSSDVHKKNSSKIPIKKADFLPFLTNFFYEHHSKKSIFRQKIEIFQFF